MPLLIKNGRIITHADDYVADIYCAGETITRIDKNIDVSTAPAGTEVIDANGKYVFPGFIDPHVHVYLPFMGTHAIDDYASASRAALAGGTTTLIEMICPGPTDEPWDAYQTWLSKARGVASVDFSYHMSVVRYDEKVREQFARIVKDGVASFKVFLAYKGALNLSDEHLFTLMADARKQGVIVTAHCENADAVAAMQAMLLAEGKTGPEWHGPSRPPVVEADGVHHLCAFAELTGAHVYTVHTSCEVALSQAIAARERGVNIWIESVIPHFLLDETFAEQPDFAGARYVMSPPLRARANQDVLWKGIANRTISTIATDHAPFTLEQKSMGKANFTRIPNGIPSVQERVDLVHTVGIARGFLDLKTMVNACSTQAAILFGMYPKKGTVQVGGDADLVVYDPAWRGTFSRATSYSNADYNAYEGWEKRGRAHVVTVRGEVQIRDGKFVGTSGRGQFIQRNPTHG
ncbi:MAG TPA: dihydropyrimidinase [Gemmatimonadales bacterium]|jgi:dihydropyrimidinase